MGKQVAQSQVLDVLSGHPFVRLFEPPLEAAAERDLNQPLTRTKPFEQLIRLAAGPVVRATGHLRGDPFVLEHGSVALLARETADKKPNESRGPARQAGLLLKRLHLSGHVVVQLERDRGTAVNLPTHSETSLTTVLFGALIVSSLTVGGK